jgi:hypothetical protein
MKLSPLSRGGVALALLLALAGSARADFIHWMYNWSRSPARVNADAPGTGYVTLTDESLRSTVGDSDVVATNLHTFSTATPDNPDRFTAKAYSLTLFLKDVNSGLAATLVFTGQFDGTLTAGSSNLTNTFTGLVTQEVLLGAHLYTVTIGPYAPAGPPGSANAGSISAHAHISVDPVIALPEPGTLALSGLGFALLGLAHWRRRLGFA